MIVIGTSGYSFRDWRGVFYPEELKPADYLAYYAKRFGAVEINTTYYGIPKPAVFEGMLGRAPDRFEYLVKLNKATTHEDNDSAVSGALLDSIRPLREAGRCLLHSSDVGGTYPAPARGGTVVGTSGPVPLEVP